MVLFQHLKAVARLLWFAGISNESYIKYLRGHGVKVGKNVNFREPSTMMIDFSRPCSIEIGNNLDINRGFTILTHDFGTFVFRTKYQDFVNSWGGVKLGSNIVIGENVTILKGVTIGDNCIIGLGSVVTRSVPPNSVVAGCPAKVISSLDDYYKKRKSLQVEEAVGYGRAILKSGRQPQIEDFTEEWSLFLTKQEYDENATVRQYVDRRLVGYVDIEEFLSRKKHFAGFDEFLKAIKAEN